MNKCYQQFIYFFFTYMIHVFSKLNLTSFLQLFISYINLVHRTSNDHTLLVIRFVMLTGNLVYLWVWIHFTFIYVYMFLTCKLVVFSIEVMKSEELFKCVTISCVCSLGIGFGDKWLARWIYRVLTWIRHFYFYTFSWLLLFSDPSSYLIGVSNHHCAGIRGKPACGDEKELSIT